MAALPYILILSKNCQGMQANYFVATINAHYSISRQHRGIFTYNKAMNGDTLPSARHLLTIWCVINVLFNYSTEALV